MALVEYISPINKMRGSVGGAIFQDTNAGSIVRGKCPGKKNTTLKQNIKNQDWLTICNSWNMLSIENKTLWNNFAVLHTHTNPYSVERKVTGFNWYATCNSYRLCFSEAMTETPPSYDVPSEAPAYILSLTNEGLFLTLDSPEASNNRILLIYMSGPLKRSSLQNTSSLKLIAICTDATFDTLNLTSVYNNYFNIDIETLSDKNKFNINAFIVPVHDTSYINYSGRKLIAPFEYIVPFEPSQLPNMKLWLEADYGITKDVNDLVSQWDDKSGQGNHVYQSNGAKQPKWYDAIKNGKPVVRFTIGSTGMYRVSSISAWGPKQTVFICWNSTSLRSQFSIPFSFQCAPYGWDAEQYSDDDNLTQGRNSGGTFSEPHPMTYRIHTFLGGNADGNDILQNNVSKCPNVNINTTGACTQIWLGGLFAEGNFSGDILGIIVCDGIVSEELCTKMYNYWNSKYGIV
jgi:hypothetical protein